MARWTALPAELKRQVLDSLDDDRAVLSFGRCDRDTFEQAQTVFGGLRRFREKKEKFESACDQFEVVAPRVMADFAACAGTFRAHVEPVRIGGRLPFPALKQLSNLCAGGRQRPVVSLNLDYRGRMSPPEDAAASSAPDVGEIDRLLPDLAFLVGPIFWAPGPLALPAHTAGVELRSYQPSVSKLVHFINRLPAVQTVKVNVDIDNEFAGVSPAEGAVLPPLVGSRMLRLRLAGLDWSSYAQWLDLFKDTAVVDVDIAFKHGLSDVPDAAPPRWSPKMTRLEIAASLFCALPSLSVAQNLQSLTISDARSSLGPHGLAQLVHLKSLSLASGWRPPSGLPPGPVDIGSTASFIAWLARTALPPVRSLQLFGYDMRRSFAEVAWPASLRVLALRSSLLGDDPPFPVQLDALLVDKRIFERGRACLRRFSAATAVYVTEEAGGHAIPLTSLPGFLNDVPPSIRILSTYGDANTWGQLGLSPY